MFDHLPTNTTQEANKRILCTQPRRLWRNNIIHWLYSWMIIQLNISTMHTILYTHVNRQYVRAISTLAPILYSRKFSYVHVAYAHQQDSLEPYHSMVSGLWRFLFLHTKYFWIWKLYKTCTIRKFPTIYYYGSSGSNLHMTTLTHWACASRWGH